MTPNPNKSFNGNVAYIAIDGVVVSAQFKKASIEPSIETVDVNRGNITHMQRKEGLADTKVTLTMGYNTDTPAQFNLFKPGLHRVTIGVEGAIAGKPKHDQLFIFTGVPIETAVEKSEVVFDISGDAADAPFSDMFNGDTF